MSRRVSPRTAAVAGLCLALASGCRHASFSAPSVAAGASAERPPLRVMTFNLRYDNPGDGANAWPDRRDWVASLIRFHGADVIGVQEALVSMLTDLDARLPGFARVGVGRADGRARGEFSAILMGEQARQEGARLIRRRLATLAGGLPVVMTGDLNATPESVPYRVLTRDTIAGAVPPLADALGASRTGHYGPTGTWTAFRAIDPARRIDYVLVSEPGAVLSHGILPDSWDGRFPSDHLPVLATLAPMCR